MKLCALTLVMPDAPSTAKASAGPRSISVWAKAPISNDDKTSKNKVNNFIIFSVLREFLSSAVTDFIGCSVLCLCNLAQFVNAPAAELRSFRMTATLEEDDCSGEHYHSEDRRGSLAKEFPGFAVLLEARVLGDRSA